MAGEVSDQSEEAHARAQDGAQLYALCIAWIIGQTLTPLRPGELKTKACCCSCCIVARYSYIW